MHIPTEHLEDNYTIQIYNSITSIDEAVWNAINISMPFYQSYSFLQKIELVQNDIQYRYVLIFYQSEIVASVYAQLLDFSFRNLVNYSASSSKGIRKKVKDIIAKKNTKLLNLGNVFFTGDKGIVCKDESRIIPLIPQLFKRISKSFETQKPSALLVANIYLEDNENCLSFCNSAFHSFTTEPDMFMTIQENWNSFDDYMNELSSKYRVRAKKVLTTSSSIIQKEFSLQDIQTQKPALEKLYNNVVNHVAFNMATMNINFLEQMKLLFLDKCSVLGYYWNEELVGFACLFNVDISTLHIHYIGLNYEINKTYKLYNRMLLDFVQFAIQHKKRQIHFGRTATEIKTTIGAVPIPLQAYLKMNNRFVNLMLPAFLKRIKPAAYIVRSPFGK